MQFMRSVFRRSLGRRAVLRGSVIAAATAAGGALLAACGGETAPTVAPTIAPTAAARPTTAATTVSTAATAAPTTGSAATAAPAVGPAVSPAMSVVPAAPTSGAAATTGMSTTAAPPNPMGLSLMPASPPDANGRIPGGSPSVPDAYVKYPSPFKSVAAVPGKGSKVSALYLTYNPPPVGKSDNTYWQELEKRLGVSSFDVVVAPAGTAYAEKIAALAAGGDFPDITTTDIDQAPDLGKIIQQGAFTELTPFLTGDALKEYPNLAKFPPTIWKNASIGGKLYGVPRPQFIQSRALAYRLDWAEKFGTPQPRTTDEFFDLMVKFTKNDPDGNGQADTYGLASTVAGDPYVLGFIQWMFRVPNVWRQNADGTLTYYIETDEFRQTLAFGRRLFEAGAYHPDAATITPNQGKDLLTAGKVGCVIDGIGGNPGVNGFRTKTKIAVPSAKISGMIPPGPDGKPAVTYNRVGYFATSSIPTKVGRMGAERVKELLRVVDWFAAPFGSEENRFKGNGIEGMHHTVKDGAPVTTDAGRAQIADLGNLSNPPITLFYANGQPDDAVFMQNLSRELAAIGIDNPATGQFSATNAAKAGELTRLHIDRTNSIIQGRDPLAALDTYVKEWRSRGGDMIRKEYEMAIKGQ